MRDIGYGIGLLFIAVIVWSTAFDSFERLSASHSQYALLPLAIPVMVAVAGVLKVYAGLTGRQR